MCFSVAHGSGVVLSVEMWGVTGMAVPCKDSIMVGDVCVVELSLVTQKEHRLGAQFLANMNG